MAQVIECLSSKCAALSSNPSTANKKKEFCKWSLVEDSGGNSEDQNSNRHVDTEDCAHEVSNKNEDSIGNWAKSHSCYMLTKSLSILCPCPETLWEAEFKGNELINQVEKILRHASFMVWVFFFWLLLARFIRRIGRKKSEWNCLNNLQN
jgi:hypothetical protein